MDVTRQFLTLQKAEKKPEEKATNIPVQANNMPVAEDLLLPCIVACAIVKCEKMSQADGQKRHCVSGCSLQAVDQLDRTLLKRKRKTSEKGYLRIWPKWAKKTRQEGRIQRKPFSHAYMQSYTSQKKRKDSKLLPAERPKTKGKQKSPSAEGGGRRSDLQDRP